MNMYWQLFLKACPYVAILVLLGVTAVQDIRITKSQQEFTQYKQDQKQAIQEYKDETERLRRGNETKAKQANTQLEAAINSGEVMRRCIASGKCRRVSVKPCNCSSPTIHSLSGSNESRGVAIPATGESAKEGVECSALIEDAAKVQLRLNLLQKEILEQPGYTNTE